MRKWRHLRRTAEAQDGFTLPELLIVLAIVGIVLVGITQLFMSAMKSQTDQTNRTQAQQEARLGLDKLRREIRCASNLTTASGSSISITLGGYCPTAGAATTVTWCTKNKNGTAPPVASAGPYTLWRYTGSASCSSPGSPDSGTKWASDLVDSALFNATVAPPTSTGPTSLTASKTLPTETIEVGSTSGFRLGANAIVVGSSGIISCAGTTPTSFIDCGGGQPGHYAAGTPVNHASTAARPTITLSVSLAVDRTPADAKQRFLLNDDIVLRNSRPN